MREKERDAGPKPTDEEIRLWAHVGIGVFQPRLASRVPAAASSNLRSFN